MKPVGPIPSEYTAIEGQLSVGGLTTSQLVDYAGRTPLFVYSRQLLSDRIALLRRHLPERVRVNYAVKANPHPDVLRHLAGVVDGFDIASSGELRILQDCGIDPRRVSFAGPGKRDEELRVALTSGVTLNCESEGELDRTLAIAAETNTTARIALRVNPSFEIKGSGMKMGGGAKQFGIDEDQVPGLARKLISAGAEWRGLHIFAGSQALSADAIIETQARTLELAARIAGDVGLPLPKLNMGGGFGIPYFPGDEPLDLDAVGNALSNQLSNLPNLLSETELCVELGRFIAGQAGVYLTRIVDRKESHGTTFLITDGGLHHQLAASGNFGTVVRRNYPVAIASRFDAEPEEVVNVVGCLCTPLDRLADQAHLPRTEVGDIVAVFCAGAYGATASPSAFLGHGPAAEILV